MAREMVETVTGPVAASDLGFTLSHEHVIVGFPGIRATYPELMDWDGIESTGIEMLSEARAVRVSTRSWTRRRLSWGGIF